MKVNDFSIKKRSHLANFVLADEINRSRKCNPRFEAMGKQVTIGETTPSTSHFW